MIDTLANIKRQMLNMQERELQSVEKVKIGIEITEQANIGSSERSNVLKRDCHFCSEIQSLSRVCE